LLKSFQENTLLPNANGNQQFSLMDSFPLHAVYVLSSKAVILEVSIGYSQEKYVCSLYITGSIR
jgi:hypothetical protein